MKYSKVVPGTTIYKITRFYLNINYGILSFNTTSISRQAFLYLTNKSSSKCENWYDDKV